MMGRGSVDRSAKYARQALGSGWVLMVAVYLQAPGGDRGLLGSQLFVFAITSVFPWFTSMVLAPAALVAMQTRVLLRCGADPNAADNRGRRQKCSGRGAPG